MTSGTAGTAISDPLGMGWLDTGGGGGGVVCCNKGGGGGTREVLFMFCNMPSISLSLKGLCPLDGTPRVFIPDSGGGAVFFLFAPGGGGAVDSLVFFFFPFFPFPFPFPFPRFNGFPFPFASNFKLLSFCF